MGGSGAAAVKRFVSPTKKRGERLNTRLKKHIFFLCAVFRLGMNATGTAHRRRAKEALLAALLWPKSHSPPRTKQNIMMSNQRLWRSADEMVLLLFWKPLCYVTTMPQNIEVKRGLLMDSPTFRSAALLLCHVPTAPPCSGGPAQQPPS